MFVCDLLQRENISREQLKCFDLIISPCCVFAGNLHSGATFSTTSMSIGSSRGPSPLTIGMSDNIPLAIAFSETINVYFKGADEAK